MRLLHRRPYLRPPAIPRQGATYEDQAPFLNSLIEDAYESEAGIFTLPMGELTLGSPLYIKKGWENFILQGHPGGTVLKALPDFVSATDDCLIGIAIESTNNVNDLWNVDPVEVVQWKAQPMLEGGTVIEFWPGQDPLSTGFYGLADQDTIPEWDDDLDVWHQITYRAEMVEVLSYNADLRRAVLSAPLTRSYDQSAQLIPMAWDTEDVRMCRNITIRNLTLNGLQATGTPPTYLPFGIYSEFCWGLQLESIRTEYFRDSHFRIDVGVNTIASDIAIIGDYDFEVLMRGLNFFWCRNIEVKDVTAGSVRHGIQFSQGNSHFSVDGYTATDSKDDGSLDCHGARNQHGVLRNFDVDKSCKVGNTSYPAGDQDIRILNGTCGIGLKVQGGSQVDVDSLSAEHLLLQTIAGYPEFYPYDCSYTSCSFTNTSGSGSNNCLYLDCFDDHGGTAFRQVTNQRFYGCSFTQTLSGGGNWSVFFNLINRPCDFHFWDSEFTNNAPNSVIENQAQDNKFRLILNFEGCRFESPSDQDYAIDFDENSVAGVSLISCEFHTGASSPEFVNASGSSVSIDSFFDNTIVP